MYGYISKRKKYLVVKKEQYPTLEVNFLKINSEVRTYMNQNNLKQELKNLTAKQ